ncbi:uncharacterized protein EAF02_003577 [Botrytis sinoallii]|uniref:uncharacterized protein n=1 Tax=Botrytis sinoallii TaxID=1463999 RepID=UPI00190104AA|nr:uncharacterized protein EAF02_003577 [Botrytis sinoallii]KAF7886930.1 hypothetical protein EAF02_003577 [Botrytis sinoallii]
MSTDERSRHSILTVFLEDFDSIRGDMQNFREMSTECSNRQQIHVRVQGSVVRLLENLRHERSVLEIRLRGLQDGLRSLLRWGDRMRVIRDNMLQNRQEEISVLRYQLATLASHLHFVESWRQELEWIRFA